MGKQIIGNDDDVLRAIHHLAKVADALWEMSVDDPFPKECLKDLERHARAIANWARKEMGR